MKARKASCAVAAPPNRRATSRWRSPFTASFHRITAGSVIDPAWVILNYAA